MVWSYVFLIWLWKFIASCLEHACLTTPQGPDFIVVELQASVGVIGCPNSCLNRKGKKFVFSLLGGNKLGKKLQILCFQWPICLSGRGIEIQPGRAPRQLLLPQMVNKHWTATSFLLSTWNHGMKKIPVFQWAAHFPCLAINSSHTWSRGAYVRRSMWYCIN